MRPKWPPHVATVAANLNFRHFHSFLLKLTKVIRWNFPCNLTISWRGSTRIRWKGVTWRQQVALSVRWLPRPFRVRLQRTELKRFNWGLNISTRLGCASLQARYLEIPGGEIGRLKFAYMSRLKSSEILKFNQISRSGVQILFRNPENIRIRNDTITCISSLIWKLHNWRNIQFKTLKI